jgi:hypothetical protein
MVMSRLAPGHMAKLTILFFIPEAQARACTVLGTGMDDQCKPDKKQPEQVMSCILGAPGQQMTFPAKSCLV